MLILWYGLAFALIGLAVLIAIIWPRKQQSDGTRFTSDIGTVELTHDMPHLMRRAMRKITSGDVLVINVTSNGKHVGFAMRTASDNSIQVDARAYSLGTPPDTSTSLLGSIIPTTAAMKPVDTIGIGSYLILHDDSIDESTLIPYPPTEVLGKVNGAWHSQVPILFDAPHMEHDLDFAVTRAIYEASGSKEYAIDISQGRATSTYLGRSKPIGSRYRVDATCDTDVLVVDGSPGCTIDVCDGVSMYKARFNIKC